MEKIVYLNRKLLPSSEAKVSVLDYGFLFGYGIFETMRAYSGKVFKLERHLERMAGSAVALGLPAERVEWEKAVRTVLEANQLREARVRLVVSAGEGSLTPDLTSCKNPTLLAMAIPYTPPAEEVYERGYRVIVSSIRRNSQSPLPTLKSANFLESLLAKQEARRAGADDSLMLNEKGRLAEATSSNVFVVSGGRLKTPGLGSGILPGITRRVVLEVAKDLGISAEEGDVSEEELRGAEEVFITNSMVEIMPVDQIDTRKIGAGPVTKRIREAYRRMVLSS